jgi:serine/threonine protein kinase
MIGKTLAHYEITSQLGKGGMGEVYQAKDLKLGRDVAIKVLPEEFAEDADRVARFQREAKLLASLNHANIAAIHGLEESGGTSFLVMELVEGQTLAERVKNGPLPVEESLKLALQIAEALEAAHEKGVIHRDLKPANIKVTPEGKVKVLDFGLAKAFAGEKEVNLSNSPTISDLATQQGIILGTAAYMSPEQARGKAVDKRTDIWAFGCVLYEMLTGRTAFSGKDVTDILAAIIRAEPEWDSLPAKLHWRLREVLERCLKKDAKDRYHDISDVKVDIQRVLTDPSGVFLQAPAGMEPRSELRTLIPWAAITVVLIVIVGIAVWYVRKPEPPQVIRFDYELLEGQQFSGDLPINVSPDGKKIVYDSSKGICVHSVDELTPKLISGTDEYDIHPFFSPDGKWIGYFSSDDRKLKKISINGGAPVTLCDVPAAGMAGASWGKDDVIVFSSYPNEILRVSAGGGTPVSLIKAKSDLLLFPKILPGGKSLLYNIGRPQPRIMAKSLKSGEAKELLPGWLAGYLPAGYLIYWPPDGSTLFAVPFDFDKLEFAGQPFSALENVGNAALSESGTLVYSSAGPAATSAQEVTLVWVNREGKEEPLGTPPKTYAYPKVSPDGMRVALSVGIFPNLDIYIWDTIRKNLSRLTFEKTREMTPVWSRDGKQIAYWSDTGGYAPNGIYLKAANGTGEAEKLVSPPETGRQLHLFSWSSDGKNLLMQEMVTWTNMDLCTLSMEGDHTKKALLQTQYSEAQPRISPDGKLIAYSSDENTGKALKTDVYVRPFPDVNAGKWQVSINGGNSPLWSPDGRELFYLSDDNFAVAVPVETTPSLNFGTPKRLFKNTNLGLTLTSGCPWDINPVSKRFLMMKPPESAAVGAASPKPKISIVLNWDEELKHRVAAK